MHTLSSISREQRITLRALSENTLLAAEQSSDRLRSWAAVMSVEHHEEPFIRFDEAEWAIHFLTADGTKDDPGAGVALETLPARKFVLVANVDFYGIDAVLDALDELVTTSGIERDAEPIEFHAHDSHGGFAVGTLAIPVRELPVGLPGDLAVESVPLIGGGGAPELVPAGDPPGAVEMPAGAVPVTAIAVTSQIGSMGETVAYLTAAELGWRYCRDSVVQDAAANDPLVDVEDVERATRHRSILDRVLETLASTPVSSMDPVMAMGSQPPILPLIPDGEIRAVVEETMVSLAEGGNVVIAGHGAAHVLRGRPGTLGVFLWAPGETRAARVANESMAGDEATRFVHDVDNERKTYFKDVYGTGWTDATAYDLSINTASVSPRAAARLIAAAVRDSGLQ